MRSFLANFIARLITCKGIGVTAAIVTGLLIIIGAIPVIREHTLLVGEHETPSPISIISPATRLSPPAVVTSESESNDESAIIITESTTFLPIAFDRFTATACDGTPSRPVSLTTEVWSTNDAPLVRDEVQIVKWHPITLSFDGPLATEVDSAPNPFLDYRLQVRFIGPSGQLYDVPGYFAGDGQGNGSGSVWQARFAADEAGRWRYCATFHTGPGVAVELDPQAGQPTAFDGANGEFDVIERDPNASGFLKWGRLEYIGGHYFKFRDGPYWLKGGTDSPENFLGYAGFDNTVDQGGILSRFLHRYLPHVDDWQPGDPDFTNSETGIDAKGIIGALNYLSERHVNSIYFLPMNLGGDGQDTYPFIVPSGTLTDNTHFDISKLYQWGIVLEHAQRKGIALHVVLNEVEPENRYWLDYGMLDIERKLFYRELVARFGYLLAIKWNLSEEVAFAPDELRQFADYLSLLDWADHPIAIHNPAGSSFAYEAIQGDPRFNATAFQYEGDHAGTLVEQWRNISAKAKQPWVIEMDENNPAGVGLSAENAGYLRRQILYDVYFSGAGGIEWYLGYHELPVGGDQNMEDFRTRERMWDYMWYARRFMEENLPFWQMGPADELLVGEAEDYGGGEVFALDGVVYAVYLPTATPGGVMTVPASKYGLHWYDPRTGEFTGGWFITTADETGLPLGAPPTNPDGDWVVLIRAVPALPGATTPQPYP